MTEKQKEMPKWLKQRYSILWESFKEDTFTMDKAVEILKSKSKARKEDVAVYISELRKLGYLIAKSNETDYRKRIYTLQPIKDIVTELRSMDKTELGRDEIESILKRAADLIRTRVDYKFILVLLFLKRISDKWQQKYDEEFRKALKDGLKESEAKKRLGL